VIFFIYYVAAMLLVAAEMRGLLRSRLLATPELPAIAWIGIIVATYVAQIATAMTMSQTGPWPLRVVTWQGGETLEVALMLLTGLVQSCALLGLYRTNAARALVIAGSAIMLFCSVATPVLTNHDLYAYVGNALLGRQAYTPPATPFAGDLSAINHWWGVPVPPATYGPLWIAIAGIVTAPFASLFAKMMALRCFGALLLGGLVVLLRAYGAPARMLAIVALNPALYFQFVLNAHNDLLPADIAVLAAIVAASRPMLAAILISTAGLVKAPFALLGLPVLARVRSPGMRSAAIVLSIVATITLSWLAGGFPYLNALALHAGSSHLESVLHVIAAVAALGVTVAAIAGLRRLRSAVWLLPMIGAYTASWYTMWSLPYAIGARRVLAYFLMWLPFVTVLAEPSLARPWTLELLIPLAAIASLQMPRHEPRRT
jgi:hypothetical protein